MKLLTNVQACELLGLKPNTLEVWRTQGKGPQYRKIGRAIRYVESDILAWIDAQTCTNTSQYSTPFCASRLAAI
ncbi:helix-turn-helix transcriptional regulator [Pseudomonas sp. LB3P81]